MLKIRRSSMERKLYHNLNITRDSESWHTKKDNPAAATAATANRSFLVSKRRQQTEVSWYQSVRRRGSDRRFDHRPAARHPVPPGQQRRLRPRFHAVRPLRRHGRVPQGAAQGQRRPLLRRVSEGSQKRSCGRRSPGKMFPGAFSYPQLVKFRPGGTLHRQFSGNPEE